MKFDQRSIRNASVDRNQRAKTLAAAAVGGTTVAVAVGGTTVAAAVEGTIAVVAEGTIAAAAAAEDTTVAVAVVEGTIVVEENNLSKNYYLPGMRSTVVETRNEKRFSLKVEMETVGYLWLCLLKRSELWW